MSYLEHAQTILEGVPGADNSEDQAVALATTLALVGIGRQVERIADRLQLHGADQNSNRGGGESTAPRDDASTDGKPPAPMSPSDRGVRAHTAAATPTAPPGRLIALDTETTGLDPLTEDVWEIGVVDLRSGMERRWCIEPRAEVVAAMHPEALKKNRYHSRTAAPDWTWDNPHQALGFLNSLLAGATIVGAVPDFDARHLTSLYLRFGYVPPRWNHRLRCVETLVMGHLKLEDVDGLRHAAELMGITVDDDARHTALGDARTAAAVWHAVHAQRAAVAGVA